MTTDGRSTADASAMSSERLRAEQIKAVCDSVTIAVIGAAVTAGVLAAEIIRLGNLDAARGSLWVTYFSFCALAHIALRVAFGRLTPTVVRVVPWGVCFTLIAFGEGLGWGWASVFLLEGQKFDVNLLLMVVVYAVAAGSVPAFSCYLPAFYTFLLPTTAPFTIESLAATEGVAGLLDRPKPTRPRLLSPEQSVGFDRIPLNAAASKPRSRRARAARSRSIRSGGDPMSSADRPGPGRRSSARV